MFSHPNKNTKPTEHDINLFHIRLFARLCVIIICVTQVFQRVFFSLAEPRLSTNSKIFYLASLPFLIVVAIIAFIEYLLFKRIGSKIFKYSRIIDFIFFLIFTVEWITTLYSAVIKAKPSTSACYSVPALFGMTSFSWRTLLQTFVTQHWQLKAIPPIVAYGLVIGYAIHFDPEETAYTLIRGIFQMAYIVILFYFEDKIRWKMMLASLHQENWLQINEFILNNIPENIMILESARKPNFISNYFQEFMKKMGCSSGVTTEFFERILDPQLQQDIESNSSSRVLSNENFDSERDEMLTVSQKWNSLQDLIVDLQSLISNGKFSERSFRIYNGKLQVGKAQKSIEIKISFLWQNGKQYMILILRDTTQRDLLIALEDNNRYKDQLLASVSHELRAPLNGNINLVEFALQSPQVPDKIKETLLLPALRSSKFLLHLINDILDMSQIKAQKLRLTFQGGSIKETLENTMQLIDIQAKKKGISLQLEVDPKLTGEFVTDHLRLSQIVLNLLNNALKFTQKGSVKLQASSVPEKPWARISVEDSGMGMEKKDLDKLFKTFTHIECKERAMVNPTGVGLGLKIAWNLVELLGPKSENKISVSSVVNQGSNFSFVLENKGLPPTAAQYNRVVSGDLPNIPDEVNIEFESTFPARLRTEASTTTLIKRMTDIDLPKVPEKSKGCECSRILIVDDNAFNIIAFETILNSLNFKHDAVYNGRDSIDKLLSRTKQRCRKDSPETCQPYSLVFMDQEMPGMSGVETVKELRSMQKNGVLPADMKIFGCTAQGDSSQIQIFLASGIDRCIHKPISTKMIKGILDEVGLKEDVQKKR